MGEQTNQTRRALFRFAVVSQVLVRVTRGERLLDAVHLVAAGEHLWFDGSARRLSARSIYRWFAAYQAHGIAGLEAKPRSATAPSHRLSAGFIDFLIQERRSDDRASIPELIRRAIERGVLEADDQVHRTTVYRTARRLRLPLARRRAMRGHDMRRFAFPHRMDMVLCDGKHFRAGASRMKRVAFFYLDDATRYVLHVVVGTSESAQLFHRGLYECIVRHGYMTAVYLDRGPGFIAEDTICVLAQLGIGLVHGEAGYKEGRGKIERFNRTVNADVLRGFDGRPEIDPACPALQLRLAHYTEQVYAHRSHEGLEGSTPSERFWTDPKPLRWPEDYPRLRAKFEICIRRRVSNDHVVSIDSIDYEMPRGYAGQHVTLRRNLLEGTISFQHDCQLIHLQPVDPIANARAPRARRWHDEEAQPMPPITAAESSFQRDFGPIVDRDGGFQDFNPGEQEATETQP